VDVISNLDLTPDQSLAGTWCVEVGFLQNGERRTAAVKVEKDKETEEWLVTATEFDVDCSAYAP
jgi:hypothetical protein